MNKYRIEIVSPTTTPMVFEGYYHHDQDAASGAMAKDEARPFRMCAVGDHVSIRVKLLKVNLRNRSTSGCKRVQ